MKALKFFLALVFCFHGLTYAQKINTPGNVIKNPIAGQVQVHAVSPFGVFVWVRIHLPQVPTSSHTRLYGQIHLKGQTQSEWVPVKLAEVPNLPMRLERSCEPQVSSAHQGVFNFSLCLGEQKYPRLGEKVLHLRFFLHDPQLSNAPLLRACISGGWVVTEILDPQQVKDREHDPLPGKTPDSPPDPMRIGNDKGRELHGSYRQ